MVAVVKVDIIHSYVVMVMVLEVDMERIKVVMVAVKVLSLC